MINGKTCAMRSILFLRSKLMNVLISTEENETQISFLNKESNDDTPSNQKQESQEVHKVNSSSEVSDIPSIE